MAHSIQNINDCTKKIIFNFENVDLTNQIKASLQEKQRTVNLKGFRKGKAPLAMIEKFYGPQVENDALYRFVSEEFFKVIKEEDIKAIGYPSFSNTKKEEQKISFEATVEIFPEIKIKDYSKYEFKKDSDKVEDKDLEELKNRYLQSKSEMISLEDKNAKLEKGQFAILNFEGEKEDGSKPDNMKAQEFMLEIGSNQFIPGFEDGMVGMKASEKKTINLTFPETYHEEDLRNAKVKFHVELLEIKEKKLPELNDDIAKEFGFESKEDFLTKNRERLQDQKKREVETKLHQEILEKLISENNFDVPSTLVEQQKKSVRDDLASNLKAQGFNDQMVETYFSKWDKDITDKALFQVRSGLILDTLAQKYNVEATEADLDAKMDVIAKQSGMDKKQVETYYKGNANIKNNLMYAIREEKTFEKLIQDMKVKA